eukprot:485971-Amorphochlora_amoeboformis.AAC.1
MESCRLWRMKGRFSFKSTTPSSFGSTTAFRCEYLLSVHHAPAVHKYWLHPHLVPHINISGLDIWVWFSNSLATSICITTYSERGGSQSLWLVYK